MKAFLLPVTLPSIYRGKVSFYLHPDNDTFFESDENYLTIHRLATKEIEPNSMDKSVLGVFKDIMEFSLLPMGFLVIKCDSNHLLEYNTGKPINLMELPDSILSYIIAGSIGKWKNIPALSKEFIKSWLHKDNKFDIFDVGFYVPHSNLVNSNPIAFELSLNSIENTDLRFNPVPKIDMKLTLDSNYSDSCRIEPHSTIEKLIRIQEDLSELLNAGISESELPMFPIQIYMDNNDYVRLKINGLHIKINDHSEDNSGDEKSHTELIGIANNLPELINLVNSFK